MDKLYIKKNTTSEELLKRVLKKYHIKYDIFYNKYGKPYIKGNPIYFNISNKNNITVLYVSDKEVGVDIEKIVFKEKLIDKICTDNEKKYIKDKKTFTKIYTMKEAYLKYLGTGISYGFKNVDTTTISGFKTKRYYNYYITTYKK